jgi:FixJ family two-component response regulator
MSVQTMKKGALNFLQKPFKNEDLLQSVSEALALSQKLKEKKEEMNKARSLIGALTPREIEILKYLLAGMLNKQVAYELDIAEHTVKIHRGLICQKLGVYSLPEILRIADKAGVVPFEKKY